MIDWRLIRFCIQTSLCFEDFYSKMCKCGSWCSFVLLCFVLQIGSDTWAEGRSHAIYSKLGYPREERTADADAYVHVVQRRYSYRASVETMGEINQSTSKTMHTTSCGPYSTIPYDRHLLCTSIKSLHVLLKIPSAPFNRD